MNSIPSEHHSVNTHPIEHILLQLKGVKSLHNGRGYVACCPAHSDSSPSLTIWEDGPDRAGICCYAGCSQDAVLAALGLTWQDLYRDKQARSAPKDGITLLDLAADKLIHPTLLAQLGITDGHTYRGNRAVHIPYYTMDGKPYERYRVRTALSAKDGTCWDPGGKAPAIPYGLQLLDHARKAGYLVFVEGESDCWTLWQRGFRALGIPGAEVLRSIRPEHLVGIKQVYIVREPDQAGSKFARELPKHLQSIGYQGDVSLLDLAISHSAKDPNDLHKKDPKAFKTAFQKALDEARPSKPATMSLKALMSMQLTPMKWIIPDILPEGLTLLCGKPKLGKSWMGLGIALDTASGGYALGKKQVERGAVLFLALEDNTRRLQSRVSTVLGSERYQNVGLPDGLEIATEWPRIGEGGIEALEQWIHEHPDTRLIVVDTWAKLAPKAQGRQRAQYDEDYEALAPLKHLADKHRIAILAVHHLRKMGSEDILDQVTGSTGLTGACDGFLVLKRERGRFDAELFVTGRDIEDEQTYKLSFDKVGAIWTLEGNAEDLARGVVQQEILDLLKEYPDGLTVKEVAESLDNKNFYTTRTLLNRLVEQGKLAHELNRYKCVVSVVSVVPVVPVVSVVSESENNRAESTPTTHDDTDYTDYTDYTSVPSSNGHIESSVPVWAEAAVKREQFLRLRDY